MKTFKEIDNIDYIETPRYISIEPVRIDAILKDRMQAFIRARQVRNMASTSK